MRPSKFITVKGRKAWLLLLGFSALTKNPISVDEEGIKFDSLLDCGYFDTV